MTRNELQAALKELRNNGTVLEVKLTAATYLLAEEYSRLVPDELDEVVTETSSNGTMTADEFNEFVGFPTGDAEYAPTAWQLELERQELLEVSEEYTEEMSKEDGSLMTGCVGNYCPAALPKLPEDDEFEPTCVAYNTVYGHVSNIVTLHKHNDHLLPSGIGQQLFEAQGYLELEGFVLAYACEVSCDVLNGQHSQLPENNDLDHWLNQVERAMTKKDTDILESLKIMCLAIANFLLDALSNAESALESWYRLDSLIWCWRAYNASQRCLYVAGRFLEGVLAFCYGFLFGYHEVST